MIVGLSNRFDFCETHGRRARFEVLKPAMQRPLERDRLWREVFRTVPRARVLRIVGGAVAGTLVVHAMVWGVAWLGGPSAETLGAPDAGRVDTQVLRGMEGGLFSPPKTQPPPPPPT